MKACIEVVVGDITKLDVDAIVNAANSSLLGGGGVDGAIHRAAGPGLVDECRGLNGCATGQAKITKGYKLQARHVIHTVGPVWRGGASGEDDALAQCYGASLNLARDNRLKSVAFPAISTGRYAFPPEKAARIAVATVLATLTEQEAAGQAVERVIFCCFNESAAALHREALAKAGS